MSGYAIVDSAAGSNERILTQPETKVSLVVLFVPVEDFLRRRFVQRIVHLKLDTSARDLSLGSSLEHNF